MYLDTDSSTIYCPAAYTPFQHNYEAEYKEGCAFMGSFVCLNHLGAGLPAASGAASCQWPPAADATSSCRLPSLPGGACIPTIQPIKTDL